MKSEQQTDNELEKIWGIWETQALMACVLVTSQARVVKDWLGSPIDKWLFGNTSLAVVEGEEFSGIPPIMVGGQTVLAPCEPSALEMLVGLKLWKKKLDWKQNLIKEENKCNFVVKRMCEILRIQTTH